MPQGPSQAALFVLSRASRIRQAPSVSRRPLRRIARTAQDL